MFVNKFPKICPNCRERQVILVVEQYKDLLHHDGRDYAIGIPDLEMLGCQACGNRAITSGSDDRLTDALRTAAKLMKPAEIREAREALRLTPEEMASETGIDEIILSRWEAGGLLQTRVLDNFLRAYFALPDVRRFLTSRASLIETSTNEDVRDSALVGSAT